MESFGTDEDIRRIVSRDIRRKAGPGMIPLEEAPRMALTERDTQILSAVQALPEKYGAVIHLYYDEGYSIKEIAHLMGLPMPAVGTRLARGRARLRELLKEDTKEPDVSRLEVSGEKAVILEENIQ